MPLYEYRCRECGHQFEIQQSLSDAALTECPACAGALRKVFSPVGIAFKGSGFYKTDSRSTGGTGGSGGTDDATGSSSGDGGSDTSSGGSDTSESSTSTSTGDGAASAPSAAGT